MDIRYKIGIFTNDVEKYKDKAIELTTKYIENNIHIVQRVTKRHSGFEIITDKSHIVFMKINQGARGYRWHKIYVLGEVDDELLNCVIYPKIIGYKKTHDSDYDENWLNEKHIEFIN